MALDTSDNALNSRIDGLRSGFAGHRAAALLRNKAYLRAFSPAFETKIGEHDQWPDQFLQSTTDHFRSSYNLTRPVVELWAALEMSEFPAIRWQNGYIPLPPPSADPMEAARRQQNYRASKLVQRTVSTMREQALMAHVRRTKLLAHAYRAVRRKNIYGLSWIKCVPDRDAQTFRLFSRIDPSTVYPIWSGADDDRLDAVLVATRRSAASVAATYPGAIEVTKDGILTEMSGYYNPTNDSSLDADRSFVWVEDYWCTDQEWAETVGDDGDEDTEIRGRVINAIRVNGKLVQKVEYPGWRALPYVPWQNENDRDESGFSDAAAMLPIQDSFNRFLSQQQDVIQGESRPKFKYRGDSERQITISDESVVALDQDEDIEQIQVHLDVFPTQVHGTQMMDMLSRVSGLPDVVWGRIAANSNSGKALATAWRAVASRMVPRTMGNTASLSTLLGLWIGWMELYNWNHAKDLYNGNRDFDLDFPNQEPRDESEVTLNALNRLQAGVIDTVQAMEETGEKSPDEMLDRVRAEYMDAVLHPDKAQAFLTLQRFEQQMQIEAQQAGLQAQQAEAQLAQLGATAPGGAPGPGSPEQQAAQSGQAQTQAAQQGAPQLAQDQNAPAAAAGQPANPAGPAGTNAQSSNLLQDGKSYNRIITK